MAKMIFVNLPVKDLKKSMEFYSKIGFKNDPQFTGDREASMVWSENIYVMLLVRDRFKDFTRKQVGDPSTTVLAINALSCETSKEVLDTFDKALKAGGKESNPPQEYDFMIGRSFEDLDGNQWELVYMDVSKFPKQ